METPLPTLTPWYELFVPSQSHSPQSPAGSNSGNDPEVASSWDCSSISDIETPKLAKSSEHPIHSSSKRSEVPPQLTRPSHLTGTNAGIVESSAAPSTSGWVCRVCLDGPTDPVATMCGHVFCHRYVEEVLNLKFICVFNSSCRSCITREISNNLQCPVCKKVMLIRLHPLVP